MHAISEPAEDLPSLADDLLQEEEDLRLPPGLRLRFALTPGPQARISGPIHARRVLEVPGALITFGEIFFPPLAWVLAAPEVGQIFEEQGWADVSDWPRYHAHRDRVDLRNLVQPLPIVRHPLHVDPDRWIQLFSDKITPLLEGHVPG